MKHYRIWISGTMNNGEPVTATTDIVAKNYKTARAKALEKAGLEAVVKVSAEARRYLIGPGGARYCPTVESTSAVEYLDPLEIAENETEAAYFRGLQG